jgi:hypothetical protein
VSKLEPRVSMVTEPAEGAVQRYQIDAPPALPAWLGSPDSLVAPAFEPVAVPLAPETTCALAKLSFAGAAVLFASTADAQARAIASVARAVPCRNLTYGL